MTGKPDLVLAGAGKMGAALLEGWLAGRGKLGAITVLDPFLSDEIAALAHAHGLALNPQIKDIAPPAGLVLAVKPQIMDEVTPGLKSLIDGGGVAISIAAGRTVASFEKVFGDKAAVVRAMPNTPAAIGRGMTVLYANPAVSTAQKALAGRLLEAVGTVAWIDDEALMDPVTAVSGSGPAYIFLLAECLAKAGVEAGLPADLADLLARETIAGAGALLAGSKEPAGTLRENVTSPGGTTAAALEVLMGEDGLAALIARAVEAATQRSRALG